MVLARSWLAYVRELLYVVTSKDVGQLLEVRVVVLRAGRISRRITMIRIVIIYYKSSVGPIGGRLITYFAKWKKDAHRNRYFRGGIYMELGL